MVMTLIEADHLRCSRGLPCPRLHTPRRNIKDFTLLEKSNTLNYSNYQATKHANSKTSQNVEEIRIQSRWNILPKISSFQGKIMNHARKQ